MMNKSFSSKCFTARGAMALFSVLFIAFSQLATAGEGEYSGFLGTDEDYARLQKVELASGQDAKRWMSPDLNLANYQQVMIDPVQLYPEPQPGPQVSEEVLQQIRSDLTDRLRSKVGSVLNVTDEAGPGVLRIEAAVTGVSIKTEGMKPYEILPVAAVFGGAKALTGIRDQDVKVFIEVRMVDSVTGERQGSVVRRIKGKQLEGKKDQLTLADVQDNLDTCTDDAADAIATALQE